jgi:hypothetical protein
MTRFICVTCQSVKDDIHQKWTDSGVSTCDVCCDKSSTGTIVNTAIDSVIEDMKLTPYERNVHGFKGLFS